MKPNFKIQFDKEDGMIEDVEDLYRIISSGCIDDRGVSWTAHSLPFKEIFVVIITICKESIECPDGIREYVTERRYRRIGSDDTIELREM